MRIPHIIASLTVIVLLASCVRKNEVIEPTPEPTAGIGGRATLRIAPENEGRNIDSFHMFLRYSGIKLDTSSHFDDSTWMIKEDGKYWGKFDSLKHGTYAIYGIGWDSNIADTVYGGSVFRIVDTLEKRYDLYLQVTPKHPQK